MNRAVADVGCIAIVLLAFTAFSHLVQGFQLVAGVCVAVAVVAAIGLGLAVPKQRL